MKKMLFLLLVIVMAIGIFAVPAAATKPAVKLGLKLDGELKVGNAVVAELWCEENPGVGAIQFTLDYDRAVLKCTGCTAGPVLQGMMNVTNPNHKDGAIVVGASATSVNDTGVLAEFTFEVLSAGDPGFRVVNARFGTETGEVLAYEVSGLEQPREPEAPEAPEVPDTPEVPETPEVPDTPENPVIPVAPSTPQRPGGTVRPSVPTGSVPETEDPVVELAFTDIEGHWAQEYLVIAKERGLVAGYPDGRCGPDDQVTRAQFVMILWKNAGWPEPEKKSDFVDLEPGEYYLDAVAWAQEKGYVAGKGEGRFAPNDPVSREEIAVILRKLPASKGGMEQMFGGMYEDHFTDSEKTSSWGRNAVYWAVYNEVWCGKADIKMGDELKATDHASRAEVAVMMVNYQDKVEG